MDGDTETYMERRDADVDDEWDFEEHIPQAIEFHMVLTDPRYESIFKKFGIPLHIQERGVDCFHKAYLYLREFIKPKINMKLSQW